MIATSGCKGYLQPASGGVGHTKRCLRALHPVLPTASPFKAIDRRTALPDSRMSTFLEFFSDAADFALSGFPIWRV